MFYKSIWFPRSKVLFDKIIKFNQNYQDQIFKIIKYLNELEAFYYLIKLPILADQMVYHN